MTQPAESAAAKTPSPAAHANDTYTLTGDRLAKAIRLSHIHTLSHFLSVAWDIIALTGLLFLGVPARIRDWAVSLSRSWWIQALVWTPLFLLLTTFIDLPLQIYLQHIELAYGLSVQTWSSWTADALKELALSLLVGYLFFMLLKWRVTRSPRTWWFQIWCITIPVTLFGMFISPMVLEPMFNDFRPLQPEQPHLVERIEEVVHHGGMEIPPSRMKLMLASKKTTQQNAYVSGFGSSKQVVVWDTDLKHGTQDEILFIFGHEMGHYVLHHIPKEIMAIEFGLLVLIYLAYRSIQWSISRYGAAWRISDQADWAAIAVFMLALTIFSFFLEPYINGVSRHYEHEADVYGLEVIHGIVANPQATASHAFQVLGEASLVDPNPNAFVEFWTGNHPPIPDRVRFAAQYDPWTPGKTPQFVKK